MSINKIFKNKSFKNNCTTIWSSLVVLGVLVALGGMVVQFGFPLSQERQNQWLMGYVIIMALFVADGIFKLFLVNDVWLYLRTNLVEYLILGLSLTALGVVYATSTQAGPFELTLILSLALQMALRVIRLNQLLSQKHFPPAPTLVASFLLIILIGSGLFMLPKATHPGHGLKYGDALFTATSAVCVTGLVVADTGQTFTPLGLTILVILIQVGGLGLMTFVAFVSMLFGKGMGLHDQIVLKDALNFEAIGDVAKMIRAIFLYTFLIEAAGAVGLYFFLPESPEGDGWARLGSCIFHSISAFCNAGFALWPDSLVAFQANLPLQSIIMILITLGGLGFIVFSNLFDVWVLSSARLQRQKWFVKLTGVRPYHRAHFSVQSKVVLSSSLFLVVTGFAWMLLLEQDHAMAKAHLGWIEKIMAALFQSVTLRTAGFNTIDFGNMTQATLFLCVLYMAVGASPGSTGGGMKTSTVAMVFLKLKAILTGRDRVEVGNRTIPQVTLDRAFMVVAVSLVFITLFTILLVLTESFNLRSFSFIHLFFETVSAFATVGLSTGLTGYLTAWGKTVIIMAMYVGRIGPLTLVLAMSQRQTYQHYHYPDESLMIG